MFISPNIIIFAKRQILFNMKKAILSLLVIFITTASVISAANPVRFGVQAGVNLSFPADAEGELSTCAGFNVGPTVSYKFKGGWFVDGALLLTSKPWKSSWGYLMPSGNGHELVPGSQTFIQNITPYYLELPITVGYSFRMSRVANLFVGIGPYVSCGLGGASKFTTVEAGKSDIKLDTGNPFEDGETGIHVKRFQAGGIAKCGVQVLDHYTFTASYQIQFNNMLPKRGHSQGLSLSFGYSF